MNRNMELVFERILDGLLIVDLDGRVHFANHAAKQVLRVSAGQLLSHPQVSHKLASIRAGHLNLPDRFALDLEGRAKGRYHTSLLASPVGTDVIILLHDVSEQMAFHAVTESLLETVHEYCLQHAYDCLAALKTAVDDSAQSQTVTAAERALAQFERRLTTVLDLAIATQGEGIAEDGRIPLDQLLHQVINTVKPAAQALRVALKCEFDGNYPIVYGSEAWLGKALEEVLAYIVSRTEERGSVNFDILPHGNFVTLNIGCSGLAPRRTTNERDLVAFAPEQSAEEGDLELGLPLAKVIVERHGGHLKFTEDLDTGITLELPVGAPVTADAVTQVQMERYAQDLTRLMARQFS